MATRSRIAADRRGSALLLATILIGILMTVTATLLGIAVSEGRNQESCSVRARILYIAEAGVSDAYADLRRNGSGVRGNRATPIPFGRGAYWTVAVKAADGSYTVTSNAVLEDQTRSVEVVLTPLDALPCLGFFGDSSVSVSASTADSYDSRIGTYSSQANQYDAVVQLGYSRSSASIASNQGISITDSSAIFGQVTPGPGHAVTGTGYITGSVLPASENVPLDPPPYDPPIAPSGAFSPVSNTSLTAGTYRFTDFDLSSVQVTFHGTVVLYVDGAFNMSGTAQLITAQGAEVTIYHKARDAADQPVDFVLSGGGLVNSDAIPSRFRVISSAPKVTIAGGAGFHGVVYAPYAEITPSGGSHIYGALMGESLVVSGGTSLHLDEALGPFGQGKRYQQVSWREVPYPP